MTLVFLAVLLALSVLGAFVSGLVGVGGAIVMIPLLLYGPPLLGVGALDVKTVAAMTMVQVFVASVSGVVAHARHRAVDPRLVRVGGGAMAAGALAGALASAWLSERALLLVFALMVTAAAAIMVVPVEEVVLGAPAGRRTFGAVSVALVAGGVGIGAGLVGAGGAFLLVPLLHVFVGVPIRVTVGSSLAITAVAATAGVVGKVVTGQVPLAPTLVVVVGAMPGAQLGALTSRRLSGTALKRALRVVIVLTGVRVWWHLLHG